jgi:hypothetical protein
MEHFRKLPLSTQELVINLVELGLTNPKVLSEMREIVKSGEDVK